jgi:hypothetical protein
MKLGISGLHYKFKEFKFRPYRFNISSVFHEAKI